MKQAMLKRTLSLLLALALLLGLLPGSVLAASAREPEITFRDVPNTYTASDLMLDSANTQKTESKQLPLATDANGNVRVSIVLEKETTLEKMDYTPGDLTQNAVAAAYRAGLEREQATMEAKIARTIGHELDVVWNLTLATNAISAWVAPEEMEAIEKLPGVRQVVPETRYEPTDADVVQPQQATSAPMIGADTAWAAGYTGKGQRIAIIDTGLDDDHQSVDEGAFLYALGDEDVDLMDKADIEAVYTQLNVYVFMDRLGYQADYSGINVRDKIVFVQRGEFNFSDKHKYASWQGARAIVIYNNVSGTAIKMDVTNSGVDIPVISITLRDANAIREMSAPVAGTEDCYTGKLTVKKAGQRAINLNSDYYSMSSFTSWGVPGDLSLKPEITAPGGSIYSIDGATAATDQYVTMSGTSMASPQVAGLSAALAQYMEETGLTISDPTPS